MHIKKIPLAIVLLCLLAAGCVEIIELPNDDPRLVIEALITNEGASVRLTSSISKTAPNEFPPIADALLRLEEESGDEIPLVKIEDGQYVSPVPAETGKRYKLQVTREGTSYTAFSTMPDSILKIDSLKHRYAIVEADSPAVSVLTFFLQDPPGEVNRGIARLTTDDGFSQEELYSDENIDGQYRIEELALDLALTRGSQLTVELLQLELSLFRYFQAIEQSRNEGAIGGLTIAPPINPQGNFDKDALGLFAAATSSKIIIEIE